jgi:hypothetical protein
MSEAKYILLEHSLYKLFDYKELYELANMFDPLDKQDQGTNESNKK